MREHNLESGRAGSKYTLKVVCEILSEDGGKGLLVIHSAYGDEQVRAFVVVQKVSIFGRSWHVEMSPCARAFVSVRGYRDLFSESHSFVRMPLTLLTRSRGALAVL